MRGFVTCTCVDVDSGDVLAEQMVPHELSRIDEISTGELEVELGPVTRTFEVRLSFDPALEVPSPPADGDSEPVAIVGVVRLQLDDVRSASKRGLVRMIREATNEMLEELVVAAHYERMKAQDDD